MNQIYYIERLFDTERAFMQWSRQILGLTRRKTLMLLYAYIFYNDLLIEMPVHYNVILPNSLHLYEKLYSIKPNVESIGRAWMTAVYRFNLGVPNPMPLSDRTAVYDFIDHYEKFYSIQSLI